MSSAARPLPTTALAIGALMLALAAASTLAAGPLAYVLWTLVACTTAAVSPALAVAGYAIAEPFQALLTRGLPQPVRYLDEVVLLGLVAITLGPIVLRRPLALVSEPFGRALALFVVWNVCSAAINAVPLETAFTGIFVTVDYLLLFMVLRATPLGPRAARTLGRVVVGLGVLATGLGLLQREMPGSLLFPWQLEMNESGVLRVPGPFEHPNDFGYFMLAATLIALASWQVSRGAGRALLAMICAMGLIVSVSRSAAAALAIGLLAGIVAGGKRSVKLPVPALVVVFALGGGLLAKGVQARIEKYQREGGDARVTYIVRSLPILSDHPIFGVGPGRFGGEIAHREPSPVYEQYGIEFNDTWSVIDSFWLHVAVESGVVGLLALVFMLLWAAARARKHLETERDPHVRTLLLAAPMLVAGFLVICASSMALEANTTSGLLWLVLGVALSAANDRVRVA